MTINQPDNLAQIVGFYGLPGQKLAGFMARLDLLPAGSKICCFWLGRKNWPIIRFYGQHDKKLAEFMVSQVQKLAGFMVQLEKVASHNLKNSDFFPVQP